MESAIPELKKCMVDSEGQEQFALTRPDLYKNHQCKPLPLDTSLCHSTTVHQFATLRQPHKLPLVLPIQSERKEIGYQFCLKTSIVILIRLMEKNESLLLSIMEEKQFIRCFHQSRKKKKGKWKYKIFEIFLLIEGLKGDIASWNNVCQQWNEIQTDYPMHFMFQNLFTNLRASFVHSIYNFLNRIQHAIHLGLLLLAFQGIQDIPASLLQKAIIGIVVYNDFLNHFNDYLHRSLITSSSYDGQHISNLLPKPLTVREMLNTIAQTKAVAFSKLLHSLIRKKILCTVEGFQNAILNNDWQWWIPMPGHVNVGLWTRSNQVNPSHGDTSDYSSETSENQRKPIAAALNSTSTGLELESECCDGLYTELQTSFSQEELNISKLVSVMHLSFMDVQNQKSDREQNWPLSNQEQCVDFTLNSSAMQNQPASYFTTIYKSELRKSVFDTLKMSFESPCYNSEDLEFRIGSSLLLSPQHAIELGNCALDLCCSLEKQVPLIQVYQHLASYLYSLASFKTWDLHFCNTLAAISNPKCVPTLLRNSGYGTLSGKYLVNCLEPLIGLELIAHTKSGFDVEQIHSDVFPRLLATLDIASSWLETQIHHTLHSWNVGAFTLITHGDLKRIIDLLKHTVNVNPVERSSSSLHSTEQSSLAFREALLRLIVFWEDIGKAITRIQNSSSTCMKQFCKACEAKAKSAFGEYMPSGKVWRQRCKRKGIPTECSAYAKILVDAVMLPVVDGVGQLPVPVQIGMVSMATKVFCETWMRHILGSQIKFSLHGAHLLRLDFNYLMEFLHSQVSLSLETRQSVQSLEVLRHLRGAAALLLRQNEPSHPSLGVRRRKVAPLCEASDTERQEDEHQMEGMDGNESVTSDSLMDEDYVIDKETWLSLRLHQNRNFSKTPFWCFS